MVIFLFIITILCILASLAFMGVLLWLCNISEESESTISKTGLIPMTAIAPIVSLIFAFITSMFSTGDPEAAIRLSVILYYVIACGMGLAIIAGCVTLIYRAVAGSTTYSVVKPMVVLFIVCAVALAASIVMIWLLS